MRIVLLFVLALASSSVFAERQSGLVSGVVVYDQDGRNMFSFKLKNNLVAGCNTSGRYVFDEGNSNYYLMSSAILTAYKMKEEVIVEYTPTCNVWSNSFDVRYVCIGDVNC
ncbi:hypothetical protein [Vibrio europaeus]|uniref:hypothetical protein n=1 Tax=Vibrio europaeus TaxID=300876 RepID=UPI00233F0E09|nr:hypothetical protein [Vibrio europaeus]MDC5855188.1 hypothetical protein [Vibrio europaeus]